MTSRCRIAALALIALLGLVAPAQARPGATEDLACPSGQITWLRGAAPAGQALLVRFDRATVGGGSAGADGRWAIPLQVTARAGVYPVAVADRADGQILATFTCYVDLPVGATPTRTPAAPQPTTVPPTTTPALPATSAAPLTTTPVPPATSPTTTTALAASATPTGVPATAPTSRPAEPTPLPTTTPTTPAGTLAIIAVQPDDPAEPGLFEYVVIANPTGAPQELTGWQLHHRDSGEIFRFPAITVPAGEQLVIWSGDGLDDPAIGSLYWPASQGRWRPGDTAALLDAAGQPVSRFAVPPPDPADAAPAPDSA